MKLDNHVAQALAWDWNKGYDTLEIAQRWRLSEAYVYNRLEMIKTLARQLRSQHEQTTIP